MLDRKYQALENCARNFLTAKGVKQLTGLSYTPETSRRSEAVRSGINHDKFIVNDREKKQVTSTIGSKKT